MRTDNVRNITKPTTFVKFAKCLLHNNLESLLKVSDDSARMAWEAPSRQEKEAVIAIRITARVAKEIRYRQNRDFNYSRAFHAARSP